MSQPRTKEPKQPKSSKTFTQEDFKRAMLFFANIDILSKSIEAMKGTPFYSQKLKQQINALQKEVDRQISLFIKLMPEIAYQQDWVDMKSICIDYLATIYETDIGKMTEFLSFIKAYRNGEIQITDD